MAASDVRDRVGARARRLPDEIDEPVIAKVEADAQPIIYLAFSSDRQSPLEITDYVDRFVKDRLQNLPGVADVRIFGERRYAMRIWLDPARLAAYSLTAAGRRDGAAPRRTSRSRRAASRAATASSPCCRGPTCGRPAEFENIIVKRRDRLSGAAARCRPGGARRRGRAA